MGYSYKLTKEIMAQKRRSSLLVKSHLASSKVLKDLSMTQVNLRAAIQLHFPYILKKYKNKAKSKSSHYLMLIMADYVSKDKNEKYIFFFTTLTE